MGTPDLPGTFGTFTYFTDDPLELPHTVPGGRVVPVAVAGDQVVLPIEGPANNLRKDRMRSLVRLNVRRDVENGVAMFETETEHVILREGVWSKWIRLNFPLLPYVKSAAGMIRIFAKKLHPDFQVYVSPVNLDPAYPELTISTPSGFSAALASSIGSYYTQGIAEDTAALRTGVLTREEYLHQSRDVAAEQFQMLRDALSRSRGGMLFIHLSGVDQDSHVLWGAHEDQLLQTYKRVDDEVGRTVRASPGSTLLVISDHGFAKFDRAVNLNTWLRTEQFLTLDVPPDSGSGEMFAHVDWSRTQAYALGLNAIYLNLAGREKNGIVNINQRDALLDRITSRLTALRDRDGQPVVASVYRPASVFHGSALQSAPDLIVGWANGYRASWQTALGAAPPGVIEDNNDEWRGDHCIAAELVPGVFLSNRKSRVADPGLADLTVTVLAEFGVQPDSAMKGRPIF
jgi:hypothetical protein